MTISLDDKVYFYKYKIDLSTFAGTYYAIDDNDRDRIINKLNSKHDYIVTELLYDKDDIVLSTISIHKDYQDFLKLMMNKKPLKKHIIEEIKKLSNYRETELLTGIDCTNEKTECLSKIEFMRRRYLKLP